MVSYLWYTVYQRAFNHVKTPITRVLAYPDYSKVFESYTDTSSNELGIVTTQGYCQLRSLRPSSLDKYRPIAFVSQNSLSRNIITVSPNWTTSHSRNLRVQRDTKRPTYSLTINLLWDVLCLTSNRKVTAWRTWAQDCLYQGIHKTVVDPSHGLSMTPVSIKQLKANLRQ
jgi:hypothetical protein